MTGESPVQIRSLEAGCSCQVTELEGGTTRWWQPGEEGKLTVKVDTGLMTGTMRKSVRVHYHDETSQKLTQVVHIEELLSVTPRTQRWKVGGPPEEKTYVISFAPGSTTVLTGVTASNEQFTYRLGKPAQKEVLSSSEQEESLPLRQQILYVKPAAGAPKSFGLFRIETDSEIPRYARISLFAVLDEKGEAP